MQISDTGHLLKVDVSKKVKIGKKSELGIGTVVEIPLKMCSR